MNSIRLKGRHLVHSQTTCKVRILVCRKIASWTESISGGKNSVTVLSYNPKDTCSNIIHSIWPKAGAYFRGRSCARFDSSYAMKRCLVKECGYNENLPNLIAQGLYLEIQPHSSRPQRHLQQPLPIFTFLNDDY